jgi:hypothetical protein
MSYKGNRWKPKEVRCLLERLDDPFAGVPEDDKPRPDRITQKALSMVAICESCPNVNNGHCKKPLTSMLKHLVQYINTNKSST